MKEKTDGHAFSHILYNYPTNQVTCKHRSVINDGFSADPHRLTIGFLCPISEPVRFIRAEFQRDFDQPFEVCSIGLQGFAV